MANDTVLAVATLTASGSLELLTIRAGKLAREPLALATPDVPVDVIGDGARVVIAFRDGALLVRDGSNQTVTSVRDALPAARPGAPPARSH